MSISGDLTMQIQRRKKGVGIVRAPSQAGLTILRDRWSLRSGAADPKMQ
jgi:hypothetical protein